MQIPTTEDLARVERKIDALSAKLDGMASADGEWKTIPEVAERFGVSVSTVQRWIREGRYDARGSGKARQVKV